MLNKVKKILKEAKETKKDIIKTGFFKQADMEIVSICEKLKIDTLENMKGLISYTTLFDYETILEFIQEEITNQVLEIAEEELSNLDYCPSFDVSVSIVKDSILIDSEFIKNDEVMCVRYILPMNEVKDFLDKKIKVLDLNENEK